MRQHLLFAGTAAAALLVASPAFAQTGGGQQGGGGQEAETNDEIVVTATKRASTVQDVPFSINAQSEADIQRSGATTIEDLSRNVAGPCRPEPRDRGKARFPSAASPRARSSAISRA
jgi:iron complex outermembrane receptor protein